MAFTSAFVSERLSSASAFAEADKGLAWKRAQPANIMQIGGNATPTRKRQRTAALQDAGAFFRALLGPRGLGVRLSSAAFTKICAHRPMPLITVRPMFAALCVVLILIGMNPQAHNGSRPITGSRGNFYRATV